MKKRVYLISLIISISILLAIIIKKENEPHDSNNNINLPYRIIGLEQARNYFEDGNHIFVDTRNEVLYRLGHIRGSINIPVSKYDEYVSGFVSKYPTTVKIVIYCGGSLCDSSYILAKKLVEIDYIDIDVFFGGWNEWSNANLPIEISNSN